MSTSLLVGWTIPLTLLALPLFAFRVADAFWMAVAIATFVAAYLLCRAAEVPASYPQHPRRPALPTPRQCRKAVYLFSALTILGSVLILYDQQGVLGVLDLSNLQQRYVDSIAESREGGRLGGGLSTLGTVLRSTLYIAIVAMVTLSKQSGARLRNAAAWCAVFAALAVSEVATASRTLVVFSVAIAVIAGFVVRHSAIRRIGTLIGLAVAAVVLFSVTTSQRVEATGGEADLALGFITELFEVDLRALGRSIADQLGFPVVTGLLYLSHSLPEFSRLVADGSSQVALGGHSFYLVIAPAERLFGLDPGMPANALAERPGMWWGMLGDLYLDFGLAFVAAFPALIIGMTKLSQALRAPDVFSLTVRCMTATMFVSSPFFGVLNSYSFTYLLTVGLALLHVSLRRNSAQAAHIQVLQS